MLELDSLWSGFNAQGFGCLVFGSAAVPGRGALEEPAEAVWEPGPSGSGVVMCGALDVGCEVDSLDCGVGLNCGVGLERSKTASALRLLVIPPASLFFPIGRRGFSEAMSWPKTGGASFAPGSALWSGAGNPAGATGTRAERCKRQRWS